MSKRNGRDMAIPNGREWLLRTLISLLGMAVGVIITLILQITAVNKEDMLTIRTDLAQNATATAVVAQRTLALEQTNDRIERELAAINLKLDALPGRIRP